MKSAKQERPRIVLSNRAIILNSKGKILLIQRIGADHSSPGLWEVPGGKLDIGQDISNALEREVFEETGLLVMPIHRVAYYESEVLTTGKYKGLPYISLIGIAHVEGNAAHCKLSEEHQAYVWVTPEEALSYDLTQGTRKALLALHTQIKAEQK